MGFLDHQGESEFPFNKETVFNAMVKAIPTVKGMKIDTADRLQGRIVVKAGVSLMSWGENIPIQLSEISENQTKVKITSTPKTGVMFGGAFDLGKNRKNIEQILSATSRILSNETLDNPKSSQSQEIITSNNHNSNNLKSNQMTEKKKMGWGKKILIGIGILFVIGIIANLGDDESSSNSNSENSSTEVKTESKKVEPKSNWNYSTDEDKMSGEKRYFATSKSTNEIEFEFPYNGGSTFKFIVRNMGKGNEVLMTVSKGQFMTSIMSSEKVRMKFDDNQPFNVSYNSADDASMDVIFFNSTEKILTKLKTSKKLMVEAPFYDAGRQIIYFDVEGLNWDK